MYSEKAVTTLKANDTVAYPENLLLLNFSKYFRQYLMDYAYTLDRLLLISTLELSNDHEEDDLRLEKSLLSRVFFLLCIRCLLHNLRTLKMLSCTFYSIPCIRGCSRWVNPRLKDTHYTLPKDNASVIHSSHCTLQYSQRKRHEFNEICSSMYRVYDRERIHYSIARECGTRSMQNILHK